MFIFDFERSFMSDFHCREWDNRFHPAIRTLRAIVESGLIGDVTGADAEMGMPSILWGKNDIRYNYELGGGGKHVHKLSDLSQLTTIRCKQPPWILDASCDFSSPSRDS